MGEGDERWKKMNTALLKTVLLCFALLGVVWGVYAAEALRLASDGRTDYAIVTQEKLQPIESAAAADLAHYLKLITGADFPIASASGARTPAAKCLFIGRRAPGDEKPFAKWERRIKSDADGNVYLYGWGDRGGTYAVYDFLDKYFGCRWFSLRGDEKIPKNPSPTLPAVDYSYMPSFPIQMYSGGHQCLEQMEAFERRNRMFILSRSTPMLISGHVPDMMVPPGGKYKNASWKPFPLFENEAWFESHPEFFSQNPEGKRVTGVQLCYSNPELRKLLNSKYEQLIKHYHKGGASLVKCNLNDNWGFSGKTLCCCPGCMALVRQYDDPAGPYWDYMLELCAFLKERYPEIIVEGSTYQITELVPKCIERLPENLMIGYAPLWRNFLKPFDHPSNARLQERLKLSLDKFQQVRVQLYASVYPRDTTIQPLIAGLRQWSTSLRYLKKLGVVELTAELGYTWQCETAFSDLRHYLIARLADDVTQDADALITEYMEHTYGKAAPKMIAFWQELEACEAEEELGLMWTGLPYGAYRYINAANLARWSQEFDAMEALTDGDSAAQLAVKSARVNLDEAILSVWPRLPKTPEFNLELVAVRLRQNLTASLEHIFAFEKDEQKRQETIERLFKRRTLNGVNFFEYAARTPLPLEGKLDRLVSSDAVFRQLPTHRKHTEHHINAYTPDAKAAFGVAMGFSLKNKTTIPTPKLRLCDVGGSDQFVALDDPRPLPVEAFKQNAGKGYRLYYIGHTRLYPMCVLWLGGMRASMNAQLSHLYDASKPEQVYDVYLSIRYSGQPSSAYLDEVVLIKRDQHSPKTEQHPIEKPMQNNK